MKKKLTTAVFFLLISGGVWAQQAPPPSQTESTLSQTESIALKAIMDRQQIIQQEIKELQNAVTGIAEDVKKSHPGYHLNIQTLGLEKDAAQSAANPTAAKPSQK